MEERIVIMTQKGEDVHVQNHGNADCFFWCLWNYPRRILPQSQTNILQHLMRTVREKRRELWETRSCLLHHDNAIAHNALGIWEFLAKNNIVLLEQLLTLQIWLLVTSFCFQTQGSHQRNSFSRLRSH